MSPCQQMWKLVGDQTIWEQQFSQRCDKTIFHIYIGQKERIHLKTCCFKIWETMHCNFRNPNLIHYLGRWNWHLFRAYLAIKEYTLSTPNLIKSKAEKYVQPWISFDVVRIMEWIEIIKSQLSKTNIYVLVWTKNALIQSFIYINPLDSGILKWYIL